LLLWSRIQVSSKIGSQRFDPPEKKCGGDGNATQEEEVDES
jgi:hypothetical protein